MERPGPGRSDLIDGDGMSAGVLPSIAPCHGGEPAGRNGTRCRMNISPKRTHGEDADKEEADEGRLKEDGLITPMTLIYKPNPRVTCRLTASVHT